MKPGMKHLFQSIGILVLTICILVLIIFISDWYKVDRYHDSALAKEFYSLIDNSNQEMLDLRNIHSVDWDELVILTPYEDICDYGISGYEKGGSNCIFTDEHDCDLLLLKNNTLAGKIAINVSTVDFARSGINGRILREKARFIYKSKGDWPKVALRSD